MLGDDALRVLAERCASLEQLDLTGCRLITDAGCAHLARLKGLTSLKLELCNKVGEPLSSLPLSLSPQFMAAALFPHDTVCLACGLSSAV